MRLRGILSQHGAGKPVCDLTMSDEDEETAKVQPEFSLMLRSST